MALDATSRAAVISYSNPLLRASVRPSGSITGAERQAIGWGYPGVIAQNIGAAVAVLQRSFRATTHRRNRTNYGQTQIG